MGSYMFPPDLKSDHDNIQKADIQYNKYYQ